VRPGLFIHLMSIETRKLFSYRVDFWVTTVVNMVVTLIVFWYLWEAMFQESGASTIGGWSLPGILTYSVLISLSGRVIRGGDLQMAISTDIYEGSLSRFLLYPSRYFFFKYAQQAGAVLPELLQSIAMGALIVLVYGIPTEVPVTATSLLMALPTILIGHLLFFMLSVIPQLVAFWAENVWSLSVLLRFITMLLGGGMLPLSLFPEWAQSILAWMPFIYLYDFPARVAMGLVTQAQWLEGMLLSLLWCGITALLAVPFWRRGELQYTGVGI